MRISDWSSDVCSSDLSSGNWTVLPSGVCRCQAGANSGEACETGIRKARKNPKSTNPARVNLITIPVWQCRPQPAECHQNRKLNQAPDRSEEHTSELQSLMRISYAVFCLKKKKTQDNHQHQIPK